MVRSSCRVDFPFQQASAERRVEVACPKAAHTHNALKSTHALEIHSKSTHFSNTNQNRIHQRHSKHQVFTQPNRTKHHSFHFWTRTFVVPDFPTQRAAVLPAGCLLQTILDPFALWAADLLRDLGWDDGHFLQIITVNRKHCCRVQPDESIGLCHVSTKVFGWHPMFQQYGTGVVTRNSMFLVPLA